MTWQEFNELVRTHLIVDSERKGRGVQENIDTLITTGVIDLQRYVPQIRDNQYKFYSNSTLVEPDPTDLSNVNSEDVDVHKGVFPTEGVRIKQIVVRRVATDDNGQTISRYFYPKIIPWTARFDLINGGIVERTSGAPGRITFGENKFWTGPKLRDDEALYLYFEGEYRPVPIYKASEDDKNAPVIFDEMEAKAVAMYVKSFLSLSVDNDPNQYQLYTGMYQKDRAQIHINRKDYKAASVEQVTGGVGSGGFVVS